LITAIIISGRSGTAYAAQIGTMSVTEEIDAMRTLGIALLDLLVLPKISVSRQTTRAVVQSIFFVIIADGLFSIAFSALDP
jgi:ABC-type transporter Mla maintaining outer membrane lipid asymmetry permease subunit MlaE